LNLATKKRRKEKKKKKKKNNKKKKKKKKKKDKQMKKVLRDKKNTIDVKPSLKTGRKEAYSTMPGGM